MTSTKAKAQITGAVYLLFSLVAIVGEFLFPTFVVPDDAAATASNILQAETSYRVSILIGFATLVIFIVLVVRLYDLLKDVDRSQALLMVLLVCIGIAVALANMTRKFTPLVLLDDADYLSAFAKSQLDALTLGAFGIHRSAAYIVTAFWGLWLFPFGYLVMKSGFIPRIFGILILLAGVGYLVTAVTAIALPEHRRIVSQIMTPLYIGEVPIIFWLMIKGVRAPSTVS